MSEIEPLVTAKPDIKISDLAIWMDHLPNDANMPGETAGAVIQQLDLESIQKSYESDLLKIATDMSRWGEYESRQTSSARKLAIARVLRLKSENRKGSSIIVNHMERTCQFRANTYGEEHYCMTEAPCCHA